MAETAPLTVLDLPCELYNYTPASDAEDLRGRFVVHYKGERKAWMERRGRSEFAIGG
jgi:hypothetical protein